MKKSADIWKYLVRDFIALGSIPFFILVLVRVWILDQPLYFLQLFIAGILFLGLFLGLKNKINLYSGLSLIALIFLGIHYADNLFWVFGVLVYFGLLGSLHYLDYNKKGIFFGVVLGGVCSFVGNYLVSVLK